MVELVSYVQSRLNSEEGQGIVEYALILAFVAVLAIYIGSSGSIGSKVSAVFSSISSAL